ncbi:MAG: TIM barrel protein [Clostridia bacterium]|nr:TIM barrel protein [Clostridia bacterium]
MAKFQIGVMTDSFKLPFEQGLAKAAEVGAQGIQLYVVDGEMKYDTFDDAKVARVRGLLEQNNLVISALCGDFGGHGFERADENAWKIPASKAVADLAVRLGTKVVTTHIGVVPEDKNDPAKADTSCEAYANMVAACREIGDYAASVGVTFAIETGPEPAERLKAFLDDVGSKGFGVNMDPANLVMCTGTDPVAAVYTLGDYIVHTHAKDGKGFIIDPRKVYTFFAEGGIEDLRLSDYFLEVPLGEGNVPFDAYLKALEDIGYKGFLTVERECGDDPYADIQMAVNFLKEKIKYKIGFIDYFLEEWHALNYPQFIREADPDGDFVVSYAYAELDKKEGGTMTTDEYCAKFGIQRCESIEEVVEKSDCIVVMSPDNPERHWDLCQLPLRSGKPVYVDKTFALSKQIAKDLVALGEESGTPFFSSSALRFADELAPLSREGIVFINSRGPGNFDTYAIHQLEPMLMLMGSNVSRVMSVGSGKYESLVLQFADGRSAVMSHYGWNGGIDFEFTASYADGTNVKIPQMSNNFPNFMKALLDFFRTGKIYAAHDETVAIMAVIEAGNRALQTPGVWVEV